MEEKKNRKKYYVSWRKTIRPDKLPIVINYLFFKARLDFVCRYVE